MITTGCAQAARVNAKAKAYRLQYFQQQLEQKKKELQLEYKEHQQQAVASFKSQEQAILDQPKQAAAGKQSVVVESPVQAAVVTQVEASDLSDEEPEDLALSKAERQLLDYHLVVSTPLPTLIPESPTKDISLSQLQGELAVSSHKYCVAIHLDNAIHLLHSAFMVGVEVYACTAKGGIKGENYVKFKQSEFIALMVGPWEPNYFAGKEDSTTRIPTTADVLATEEVELFLLSNAIYQVHVQVANQTTRPLSMVLLSGELYHTLVSAFGIPGDEYGFKCGVFKALSHVRTVALAADHPKKYDSLVYFLIASAQGLNPSKAELDEVPSDFFLTGIAKQKLKIRQWGFLKYQLDDITPEHDDGFPPTIPVVTTPPTADYATGQANGRASISYVSTIRGGGVLHLDEHALFNSRPGPYAN